jgi:hypothetical protein
MAAELPGMAMVRERHPSASVSAVKGGNGVFTDNKKNNSLAVPQSAHCMSKADIEANI